MSNQAEDFKTPQNVPNAQAQEQPPQAQSTQQSQLVQELKPQYSFNIETPKQETFYFKLDKEHCPIKLGDGTYGIVFEVHDSLRREYAAKLLYQDQETDRSEERFRREMKSSQLINDLIEESLGDRNTFAGVIETEGGTEHFHDSPAYNSLKSFLQPLSVSNYVLVMPKYEKTLKQLLEEERKDIFTLPGTNTTVTTFFPSDIPIGSYDELTNEISKRVEQVYASTTEEERKETQKELERKIYSITGYEVLKRMDFVERINNIQPYIYDVAQGLKTLHQVKLLHLDLKPANVLVRKKGTKIETVIGDLGFLDEANREHLNAPYKPYLEQEERPSLPLGTRHYRSPEQKDYFDVADVEVIVDLEIKLIIKDPKFNDTIIEDTDVVSFSKYKKEYEIAEVSRKVGETTTFHITLKKQPNQEEQSIQPDKRTQVYFYKRQRHRTDLFGFGALMFELLTCGNSPERFYEAIRRYDTPDQDVDSIMDLYRQVSNFQSTEPSLVQIFSPFKLHDASSIYAPPEIVMLILRCMLYKAKSTFYSRTEEQEKPGSTMEAVISDLEDLYYNRNSQFETSELAKKNKLYHIDTQKAISPQNLVDFSNDLANLRQFAKKDFPKRLSRGIQYFEKLIQLIQNLVSNDIAYFFELMPKNITQDQSGLGVRYIVYENQSRYMDDLRKDFVYTKINRDPTNPYVPNFFNYIRRPIRLKAKYNINKKPSTLDCTVYEFMDASPYGNMIRREDWVLIKLRGNSYLWQVSDLSGDSWKLRLSIPSEDEEERKDYENAFRNIEEGEIEAIFYKDLSPTVYYINMLGIYIYHLFFVGLDDNGHDKPSLENSIRSFGIDLIEKIKIRSPSSQLGVKSIIDQPAKPKGNKYGWFNRPKPVENQEHQQELSQKEAQLKQIILTLASMYLKLVFVESKDSYFSQRASIEECLITVRDALHKLKGEVANFLGYEVVRLDGMNPQLEKQLPQLSRLSVDPDQVSFSFNRLISSLIRVPSNADEAYLKEIFQDEP
ncbi:protein kinase domain-containing protein [Pantanalinema rosaneae CENA516]|uniref:protein kinase domain-containing protein n=1 Tax=Pantanalinema rosaneae TaxID=1620701 RepID=UPI003D6EF5F7